MESIMHLQSQFLTHEKSPGVSKEMEDIRICVLYATPNGPSTSHPPPAPFPPPFYAASAAIRASTSHGSAMNADEFLVHDFFNHRSRPTGPAQATAHHLLSKSSLDDCAPALTCTQCTGAGALAPACTHRRWCVPNVYRHAYTPAPMHAPARTQPVASAPRAGFSTHVPTPTACTYPPPALFYGQTDDPRARPRRATRHAADSAQGGQGRTDSARAHAAETACARRTALVPKRAVERTHVGGKAMKEWAAQARGGTAHARGERRIMRARARIARRTEAGAADGQCTRAHGGQGAHTRGERRVVDRAPMDARRMDRTHGEWTVRACTVEIACTRRTAGPGPPTRAADRVPTPACGGQRVHARGGHRGLCPRARWSARARRPERAEDRARRVTWAAHAAALHILLF
ncbi:hypothetical protein GGX14DRAFT_657666 [Mycena pura]|uniref:Uncharacterized protein n=1 Tax=Mycena pura TaxID=153505 RepID=A0AAD6YLV4_9AGAR|nr:hypothetical protein GGX14DRAFT_657666 [Mycena pura]